MLELLKDYPSFVHFIMWVGAVRLAMKPLQPLTSAALEFVKLSPSKSDDAVVEKISSSKLFKIVKFIVDWLLSVKL